MQKNKDKVLISIIRLNETGIQNSRFFLFIPFLLEIISNNSTFDLKTKCTFSVKKLVLVKSNYGCRNKNINPDLFSICCYQHITCFHISSISFIKLSHSFQYD